MFNALSARLKYSGLCKRWIPLLTLLTIVSYSGLKAQVNKSSQTTKQSLFTLLPSSSTGVSFRNDIDITKINALSYLNAHNGGGVAAGDLNNDGMCDLVFVSNQKGPVIYLNKGGMKFEDITAKSGITGYDRWYTGITLVDINHDGWLDIYACCAGADSTKWSNLLFINNHNGTFTEQSKKYGLQNNQACTQAYFFDYDNDGDLDVYLVNHPKVFSPINSNPYAYSDSGMNKMGKDRLMENVGDTFIDVSDKAGINPQLSYGLSAAVTDVNNDGYPDLYVANDFLSPDHFYINNGNGTFTEKTTDYFRETSSSAMGSDFGDLNNDGYQDLIVVDMMPDSHERMKTNFDVGPVYWTYNFHKLLPPAQFVQNSLQLSNSGKSFSQISMVTGTARTNWSWNVNIDDLNNDGWNDIFITQGIQRDFLDLDYMRLQSDPEHMSAFRHSPDSMIYMMPVSKFTNRLFINNGSLNFSDETLSAGFADKVISSGAVTADLDNDGALDIIINNTNGEAFIYHNNTNQDGSKHYLRIKFEGDSLNKFGIGTVVDLYTHDGTQHKQLANSRGYASCPEQVMHFGLGEVNRVDSLVVKWYDRTTQTLYNVAANQVLTLKKRDAKKHHTNSVSVKPLLTEVHPKGLSNVHKEDDFIDYQKDRLIPFMISREGPATAVADVNKDGLQDVFIGGAVYGSKGALLVQQQDGSFKPFDSQPWKQTDMETTGAVFADFNGDGYMDLYLSNGSNEFTKNDPRMHDRLYLNNAGKSFTDASAMLPVMQGAKTSPVAFDFDGDGKMDLFVAGRMMPGEYPSSSRSYLLHNDGAHFTDVTEALCPELATAGNVTAAYAADLNGDGKLDLIVVSEWEPVKFFKNTGKSFERVLTGSALDTLRGWWKCIAAADLNGDGKLDFLIGNQGLNSYLKATPEEPISLYYNDFDDNGVKEPLLTYYLKGKNDLLYDRNTLCEQMPKFRNNFLTYSAYAQKGLNTVLSADKIKTSEIFHANYFKSIWIENKGDFHFEIHELPDRVQWAPANTFVVTDLNGDGKPDVIVGANSESDLYWAGRSNSSLGVVLLNKGDNQFKSIDADKSGFLNPYVCRHLQMLQIKGYKTKCMLVVNNNMDLRVFELPK